MWRVWFNFPLQDIQQQEWRREVHQERMTSTDVLEVGCGDCELTFLYMTAEQRERRREHQELMTSTDVLEVGCGDCELIFLCKTSYNESGDERCTWNNASH